MFKVKRLGAQSVVRRHFDTGEELMAYVREHFGDTVILSFSRGKDAIGAWLALRRVFPRVLAFHLDNLPGLGFVEESLAYYERFFGTRIERYIHPSFYRQLDALAYQPPERCSIIEQARIHRRLEFKDVEDDMRARFNCPTAYVATGVRAADSFVRRTSIKKHGALTVSKRKFHPVFDWKGDRLLDELVKAGVKLPAEYRWFGRTFDGLHAEYLGPLSRNRPADYQRILDWFPLASMELARVKLYEKHGMGGAP